MTKKLRGPSGKKLAQKSRNSCIVNGRGCGCIGTVDSRHNFFAILEPNTNAQRMSLLSHLLRSAVGTFGRDCLFFCAVSNRESRYHPNRSKQQSHKTGLLKQPSHQPPHDEILLKITRAWYSSWRGTHFVLRISQCWKRVLSHFLWY